MNDNLPDINFKEKKEKKGGALGWLRGKFGGGSGGSMGQAGINPAVMNVGKALGTAKFGASSAGIAGLLAGKAGMLATIAMMAVAGGVYMARNAPVPNPSTGAFSSSQNPDNYVPAILRSQAANNGSSLDMFKETNKGSGLSMEAEAAAAAKKAQEAKSAPAEDGAAPDAEQPAPEQDDMAQRMEAKLQGGSMGSLTSQLGGGSNKFSNMGGFGNKFNQGATGAKTGFGSGIGSGFSSMPNFDKRKGKMLAMKGTARPVFTSGKAGKKGKFGAGSFGQAKGMRDVQKSYSGTSIDAARSTQDKAWEGETGAGSVGAGGAGLGDGGAGVMSSPSLDNADSSGGGGGTGTPSEPVVPDTTPPENVSPWASLVTSILMLITVSAVLSAIASKVSGTVFGYAIAVIIAAVAAALAAVALVMAIMLMTEHGQELMGGLYAVGAGLALVAAVAALGGGSEAVMAPGTATTVMWLAAGAGIIILMGSMFEGK